MGSLTRQSRKAFFAKTGMLVFFDLDGVLADFDAHADATGARTERGIDWKKTNYAWWKSMPPAPGAKAFYDAVKARAGAVRFLSGPTIDEESFSGKAAWVQKFVPERGRGILRDLILCTAKDKYLLAAPNRILIDDSEDNVRDWRAAGGLAIHHKGDFAETLKELEKLFNPPKPAAKGPQPL